MGTAIVTTAGARRIGQEWLKGKKVSFSGIDTQNVTEIYYGNKRLGDTLSYTGNEPELEKLRFDDGTPVK